MTQDPEGGLGPCVPLQASPCTVPLNPMGIVETTGSRPRHRMAFFQLVGSSPCCMCVCKACCMRLVPRIVCVYIPPLQSSNGEQQAHIMPCSGTCWVLAALPVYGGERRLVRAPSNYLNVRRKGCRCVDDAAEQADVIAGQADIKTGQADVTSVQFALHNTGNSSNPMYNPTEEALESLQPLRAEFMI